MNSLRSTLQLVGRCCGYFQRPIMVVYTTNVHYGIYKPKLQGSLSSDIFPMCPGLVLTLHYTCYYIAVLEFTYWNINVLTLKNTTLSIVSLSLAAQMLIKTLCPWGAMTWGSLGRPPFPTGWSNLLLLRVPTLVTIINLIFSSF